MTTVHIIFRDTDDGMVETETTITAWEKGSNAIALTDRINMHMAAIAKLQTVKESPKLALVG